MHAASRDSLQAVQSKFDDIVGGLDDSKLLDFADNLAAVADLLVSEVVLRKHIAGNAEDEAPKVALVESLFSGKIGAEALDIVRTAAAQRWSKSRDLTDALERFANLAVVVDAERAGQLDNLEDELFRFGRTLDANPKLATLLGTSSAPAAGRVQLLDDVLAGKASQYTERLLRQAVQLVHGRNIEEIVPQLAELAAARRGESVAHVTAASALSDAQLERLEAVLSRIYDRNMSVQLDIDPDVLGGLRITVGDEVVDGTIASRLAGAASQLPD